MNGEEGEDEGGGGLKDENLGDECVVERGKDDEDKLDKDNGEKLGKMMWSLLISLGVIPAMLLGVEGVPQNLSRLLGWLLRARECQV